VPLPAGARATDATGLDDLDDLDDAVDLDAVPATKGPGGHPAAASGPRAPQHPGPRREGRRVPGWRTWPEGTPPWLRSPLGTAVVAALAAGLTGLLVGVRASAVQDERLQEQQAGTSVVAASGELVAVHLPDSADYNTRATVDLQLVNAGPAPLTLLDARLSGDGSLVRAHLGAGQVLAPASSTHVLLTGPVRCALDGRATTGAPRVRVRTPDGAEHERALAVPTTAGWSGGLERACALGATSS
jgi:hypothetical protein